MTTNLHGLFRGLDATSLERLSSRRETLRSGGRLMGALALSATPAVVATTARDAFAATGGLPGAVVDVLNFALTLEYLEASFYNRGLRNGVVPAGKPRRVFETIMEHENAHVAFLKRTLGSQAIDKPDFDFTAGGAIANPFTNYELFMILAQGFEDAGVRAYKGQLGALKPYDAYLAAAASIHSIEARHAAEVRRLRGSQGWIPNGQYSAPQAIRDVYAGEDNTIQLGVDVSQYLGRVNATEAFDEPLVQSAVLFLVGPFIRA